MHLLAKLKRFRLFVPGPDDNLKNIFQVASNLGASNPRDNSLMLGNLGADCLFLGVTELLKKSRSLLVTESLAHPLNVIDAECGGNLKEIFVINCYALEYLVDLTRTETTSVVFPVLASLYIRGARKLKEIFHGVLPVGSLISLTSMKISHAHELMHVWKTGGDQFDRLEHLRVRYCKSLQVIVAGHHEEEASDDQLNFPNLTNLNLYDLPELVGITSRKVCKLNFSKLLYLRLGNLPKFRNWMAPSSNSGDVVVQHLFDSKVNFPVLKSLIIKGMHNFEDIWHNQLSPYSFLELTNLDVENCDKILHLVPTYMQNRLQKLEVLYVDCCSSLQEIFEMRKSRVDEDEEPRETSTNFYPHDQGILHTNNQIMGFKVFQNLKDISVIGCGSLTIMCSSSIARGLVNLIELSITQCYKMEEIVAAEEGEEEEDNNMFPGLTSLTLYDVPNLVKFSRHKYALDWLSLEKITIEKCPAMKKFSLGSLITSVGLEIDISDDVDENIRREIGMSKRKA